MLQGIKTRQAATTWLITPMLLTGCLMNDPVETTISADPNPPNPTNNAPVISGNPPQMIKVGVNYLFTPTASDPDADPISFSIENKPNWTSFDQATGTLSGFPVLGSEGTYADIVISVSDGSMSSSIPPFMITVEPATAPNMPPAIDGVPDTNVIVGNAYSFTPAASDPDGDLLTFTAQNLPAWAMFNSSTGQISGTPQPGDEGTYANISITVSDGSLSASLPAFTIVVQAQNSAPTISGTPSSQTTVGLNYSFTPTAADPDGDTLTFSIQNMPGWASFNSSTGELSGTPQSGNVGDYAGIAISVSDGQASASLPPFSITVNAANSAPTISGTPSLQVTAGQLYSFTPTASDPDGDTLAFSIQNRPSWLSFDANTGELTGTPQPADLGVHAQIVISVSDGSLSTSLPIFSITVVAANSAPQITGTPAAQVTVGQSYSFTPNGSDPDGDSLTFSVQNLPSWAGFDSMTGTLSGTPQAGAEGIYSNISITVSDGALSASLPMFNITVDQVSLGSATLTWTPPTQNTDGSPLTDLDGYVVYYGLAAGSYSNQIVLNNPGLSTYVVDNLAPNTYYFSITAKNSIGIESNFSNVASKTIN